MVTETTQKTINWGSVLKGAAIVATIAVAAVAVGFIAQAAVLGIGAAIEANLTATALATTAGSGVGTVANGILTGLQYAGNFLTSLPSAFVSAFGLTGTAAQVAAGTQAVAGTAAVAAGAATLGVGMHAAHPTLSQLDYSQTISGTTAAMQSAQATHAAHAAHIAEMAHMSHHAAEHAQHQSTQANWADRFTSKGPAANFADTVASRKSTDIVPRDGTFAAKVEADTAKLNKELGL